MTVRENERNRLVTAVDFAAHCGSNNRHSFLYRRNYCLVGGTAAEPKPEDFCRRCNNTADGAATYGSRLLFTVFFWQQPLFGPAYLSGIKIAFSWLATVLAAAVISLPLMYRSARGALSQVDKGMLEAARSLGMTEWRIFWRIHLPNALPGIIAGGLLAFARGLGEFGATAMIAGNIAGRTRTLPLAVYSAVAAGDWDAAGWDVAVIVGICLLVVIGLNGYLYKTKQQQGE